MTKCKKEKIGDTNILLIHDCPIEIVSEAFQFSHGSPTIENWNPISYLRWSKLQLQLSPDLKINEYDIRAMSMDICLDREEFNGLLDVIDKIGIYAVFTEISPLKFRATDLDGVARYKALSNFNWSLEIAVPGPSGPDWSSFASPKASVIEELYEKAINHLK